MLQKLKVLNAKGQLCLLSSTDVQEAKRKPIADVKLSDAMVFQINDLLELYSKVFYRLTFGLKLIFPILFTSIEHDYVTNIEICHMLK